MIDKQTIAYLRLVHGAYNTLMMFLFIYQGSLGLRIRRQRKAGGKPQFNIIKRHRKTGPVLAVMGIAGFFAGVTLAYLDYGHLLKYPLHFIIGWDIALLISATFFISGKIKGPDHKWRNLHFSLGILILTLYPVQLFLGTGILF
ncbi:MAG: DUF4079 family protein [Nitrospirae bacterium]|nr:DUF4079 family protein [Nitrospirota bacterium]MBI4847242.1 DUF4079 family protein [Nitrospirota bacterium]